MDEKKGATEVLTKVKAEIIKQGINLPEELWNKFEIIISNTYHIGYKDAHTEILNFIIKQK